MLQSNATVAKLLLRSNFVSSSISFCLTLGFLLSGAAAVQRTLTLLTREIFDPNVVLFICTGFWLIPCGMQTIYEEMDRKKK